VDSGFYIVATPIGNLRDMSYRAVDILQGVDLIAAEDTRHSQRLLQHYTITTPTLAYHDHSDERALIKIENCLASGGSVALVSDAGTPLISDPGYRLVRFVQERGYAVRPVPGACAAIAALSVSGLATDRFMFEGFLPVKPGTRSNRLESLAGETATLIFYEAPHRVRDCLEAMRNAFGSEREAVLAREITKTFETVKRGSLAELVGFVGADDNQQRGEIVILVAGKRGGEQEMGERTSALLRRLAQELPAKRAAAIVAEHTGLRKKELYRYLLSLKVDGPSK
jgi:16S rRNA (cytidine1402-2'-O)-methyltransferase